MADSLVKKAYAPLANGSLKKPAGMYRPRLEAVRRASIPTAVVCYGVLGLMYYGLFYRHNQKINNYYQNLDPDKLFHEIREFGVLKYAKASWQEEE